MTGQRVLSVKEEERPKIETSFSARGKFKGIDVTETTTYWSIPRPGGISLEYLNTRWMSLEAVGQKSGNGNRRV